MSRASQSRLAPPCVYLLAEHLDAALAAGEDLARVRYVWSGPPARSREEIEEIRSSQRTAIDRIRTFEMALLSRLLMGREWAVVVAVEEEKFSAVARLYVAGTATLLDAVGECADSTAVDFDTGDDLMAYVRSRGLITEDAASLADTAPIAAGEDFLVARRVPLGVLLDLVATFLDALETEFDLFEEVGRGDTPTERPAAAAPAL
jgi:hypothetical protein